ncbi:MAG: hypothetical protein JXA58_05520 [Dehalococcoidia bacterium]|nr:hypothetical protein [Dehalococcoidia bacterium]
MHRRCFGSTLLLSLCAMLAGGCGAGSTELDVAYARGYADGVASVEDGHGAAGQTYEQGYADGLADAADAASEEVCQRCY